MSLRDQFDQAEVYRKDFLASGESEHLEAAVQAYLLCQDSIRRLALFSSNETLDDVSTNELRYFLVDYHLATLIQQKRAGADRKRILESALDFYRRFLSLCNTYQAYPPEDSRQLRKVLDSNGSEPMCDTGGSASDRRENKIKQFKHEQSLQQNLDILSSKIDEDDDRFRKIGILTLHLSVSRSLQDVVMIRSELDLLSAIESEVRAKPTATNERARKSSDSWTLDRSEKDLIDKQGKVMKPFVILSKRDTLRKEVRGPGHSLPTMTIDEYLDQERARGGILDPSTKTEAPSAAPDEDDEDANEASRRKAIDWDNFTEQNPKGIGNTMNRG